MTSPLVLLVEDEDLFREVAVEALKRGLPGTRVVCAANGRDAVLMIEQEAPTLLVTDLQMPLLDGFGVLLFAATRAVHIPVIVMSAFLTADMENRAEAGGAIQTVEKPVDVEHLTELVRGLLDSRMTGHVEGVTLPGFVQLLQIERQNVTLRIESGDTTGLLHFRSGELIDAWDGSNSGDLAAKNIFAWAHVQMDLVTPRMSNRSTVTLPATHLIMESARQSDEGSRAGAVGTAGSSRSPRRPPSAAAFLAARGVEMGPVPERKSVRLPRRSSTTKFTAITPSTQPRNEEKRNPMSQTISTALENIMKIDGTIGTCLCDWTSGLTLGFLGGQGRINIELAGSLNCQVVRAKMDAMSALGIKGSIEDILITLDDQYHLIRPLKKAPTVFLYVAIDRVKGNLGLARMKLQQIEANIEV